MSPAARMKPILPWWQLTALLTLCAVGIWFLLPDDPQLLDDLVRDGKTKEARALLTKVAPEKRARAKERFTLLELRLAKQEQHASDPAALDAWWRQAAAAWRDTQFSGAVFLEMTPAIPRLRDPAAAWSLLAGDIARAPAKQRERLVADFVRAALATSQPAAAAQIFAAGAPANGRSEKDALELARLWRLAGRPTEALAALGELHTPAVETRRIELLRELSRNREAFALLRTQIESAANPPPAVVEELVGIAVQANLASEAAPLVTRYLEQHPRELALQRRLRALHLAAGQPAAALPAARAAVELGGRASDDVRELARILEFAGQPAAAFDLWLELALAGNVPALERLVALNPGLYRDADLLRALERLVPVAGRDDYTLALARLELAFGRYDRARQHFEAYIARVADPAALVELAHLHSELYRFADAEAWLRRALALKPGDLALQREIAESLVAQNRSADALALYAQLAAQSPTEEILGPYIRLAESLGRYGDFVRGLRLRLDHAPTPAARDYALLAYGYELLDEQAKREAALHEGLRRAGQSDDLRLQLAFALAGEKKYQEAQAALASNARLHDDPATALLYLELLRLNNDTAAERRYLAAPLPPALLHDEAILERLARAHEALGAFAEAERLQRELLALRPDFERTADLARVLLLRNRAAEAAALLAPFLQKPTPAVLRLAATIAETAGDHRSAEKYQLAYLDAVRSAPAADWGALGDIRLARGDRTGAKRAYAEALRRLQSTLAAGGTTR